jgi:septal ring factor EnvC (AmiA/AmiB activator)
MGQSPTIMNLSSSTGKITDRIPSVPPIVPLATVLLLFLLVPLFLLPPSSPAQVDDQISEKERDLEALRQELTQKRAQKEALEGREQGVLSEIQNLEQRIHLAEKLLGQLKSKKASCQKEIGTLRSDLEQAQRRAAGRREVLADRARQLYMHGRLDELEVFLSAQSLPDLSGRIHRYRHVAEDDRRLIEAALADQRIISENTAKLEKTLAETRRLEEEKHREEQKLLTEKDDRGQRLREIQDQKATYDRAIAEMEESARQIQSIIDLLERQRQQEPPAVEGQVDFFEQTGPFEDLKGSLPWPVKGRVIKTFGRQVHPKYKTVTLSKGVDIQAPTGTDIRAVADGKVLYSSWLRGYGQFLILSHSRGYYTLYAHASEILVEVNDVVRAGQVIARVGETGSLDGPKLHFEVRHSKEQLDPLAWLKRS